MFNEIQGEVMKFFMVSVVIGSGKVQLSTLGVEPSNRALAANITSKLFKAVGKIFSVSGITWAFSTGLSQIGKFYQNKKIKEVVKKYNTIGGLGEGNYLEQSKIAKNIAMKYIIDVYESNPLKLDMNRDADKYVELFHLYYEICLFASMLKLSQIDDLEDIEFENRLFDSINSLMLERVALHKEPGEINKFFDGLADFTKKRLGTIAGMDPYSFDKFLSNIQDKIMNSGI